MTSERYKGSTFTAKVALRTEEMSGEECLQLLKRRGSEFHAVLMDIQMPGMNGYETAKRIRADDRAFHTIPIIAMTANAFEEDILRAKRAGMDAYISKPVEVSAIKEVLSSILNG